jgi:hypothetical protein
MEFARGSGLICLSHRPQLAWEAGQKLMPRRGSFKTLYDAMQLAACGVPGPNTTDTYVAPRNALKGASIYVDALKGNDQTGTGTLAAPLQTIGKAIASATKSPTQKTVVLRAGAPWMWHDNFYVVEWWRRFALFIWIGFALSGRCASLLGGLSFQSAVSQRHAQHV